VPYGLFLSGGVDSAAIATLMARLNERPVIALTCGFDGPDARDERAQAERVARALNLDWRETLFTAEDFWADLKRIEVGAETTVIKAALIDDIQREIHMNTESHDQAEPTNQGHSIGRFEGDVLVVDTARFAGNASGIRTGVPSSSRKHLVERFELSSDRTRLTYSYELEDPEYLTQPVRGSVEWIHRPDLTYASYDCNRDSAGRFLAE
jgi:hypothetical protein